MRPCTQEVRYGNGDIEPMVGEVSLPVTVNGIAMPMLAYVLKSKGPSLIMGFTFLEANQLLVDCTSRTLTMKDGRGQVKCLPLQAASAGLTPPLDATYPLTYQPTQSHPEALIVQ